MEIKSAFIYKLTGVWRRVILSIVLTERAKSNCISGSSTWPPPDATDAATNSAKNKFASTLIPTVIPSTVEHFKL